MSERFKIKCSQRQILVGHLLLLKLKLLLSKHCDLSTIDKAMPNNSNVYDWNAPTSQTKMRKHERRGNLYLRIAGDS